MEKNVLFNLNMFVIIKDAVNYLNEILQIILSDDSVYNNILDELNIDERDFEVLLNSEIKKIENDDLLLK